MQSIGWLYSFIHFGTKNSGHSNCYALMQLIQNFGLDCFLLLVLWCSGAVIACF